MMKDQIFSKFRVLGILSLCGLSLVGCGQQNSETETGTDNDQISAELSGAGASFPAPLYKRWFSIYNRNVNPNIKVSYDSIGSGGGVEKYLDGTVDFAASDAPLRQHERSEFQNTFGAEPIQLPTVGGAVVFAYNIPEIAGKELKLSRETYCGIVTGKITSWDNSMIAEDNPNLELPSRDISFVHRSDGSGTTFILTNHINTVCDDWNAGAAKSVNWPTGTGRDGNEGVADEIQRNEGTIGYIEFALAKENDIAMATLENQSGNFVKPSPETASAAFEGTEIPDDFALEVPNPKTPDAYPIAGLTWLLIYPEYDNENKYKALKRILKWGYQNKGEEIAVELGYIPIPKDVEQEAINVIDNDVKVASENNQTRTASEK